MVSHWLAKKSFFVHNLFCLPYSSYLRALNNQQIETLIGHNVGCYVTSHFLKTGTPRAAPRSCAMRVILRRHLECLGFAVVQKWHFSARNRQIVI